MDRLFVSVVIEALRNTNDKVPMMRKLNSTIDSQVPSYFFKRLKLRLGLEKAKQVCLKKINIKKLETFFKSIFSNTDVFFKNFFSTFKFILKQKLFRT